jgi:hypothetical protein
VSGNSLSVTFLDTNIVVMLDDAPPNMMELFVPYVKVFLKMVKSSGYLPVFF